MRRMYPWIVAATAALFLASSSSLAVKLATDDDSGHDRSSATSATTTTTTEPKAKSDGGRVALVEAGAEPRQKLRLQLRPGSTARTRMTARLSMTIAIDGEPFPVPEQPAFQVDLVERVVKVAHDGTAQLDLAYDGVRVLGQTGDDPSAAADLETTLRDLDGLTGRATVDAQGQALSMNFDTGQVSNALAAQLVESLSDQIRSLSLRFPDEPVGIGARWTHTTTSSILGIHSTNVTTYTLAGLDGDAYRLEYATATTAERQPGPGRLASLLSGVRTTIESFEVKTTGTAGGRLTQAFRNSGDNSGIGDIVMSISEGGDTSRVVMHQEVTTSLAPA